LFNGQTSDQGPPSERQVGMKSKHEDEDEYDLEWEEARRCLFNEVPLSCHAHCWDLLRRAFSCMFS